MENDREIQQILMNVKNLSGNIITTSLFSARITFALVIYLMRLAEKGLVTIGAADNFKNFVKLTGGNHTIYNIPVSKEKSECLKKINRLDLELQKAINPMEKMKLRQEIKELWKEIPELNNLKTLPIKHCILPKLNGTQTIQIAIDKKSDQLFKNWFLNHLSENLSGGEKNIADLKVFTEMNYTIFNVPLEGEALSLAKNDFQILDINYAILPDLSTGDGYTQIAISNADRNRLEMWFSMWKNKQLQEGKEVGEMYHMGQNTYLETGAISETDYINQSEPEYQKANAEYTEKSTEVPWNTPLQKENSEQYAKFLKDENYEKITINGESLTRGLESNKKNQEMMKNGYFLSRIPGTYGENKKTLILPMEQVFSTDQGKTYLAFLPKNNTSMVADCHGNITNQKFSEIYQNYDSVQRGFQKIEALKLGLSKEKIKTPSINRVSQENTDILKKATTGKSIPLK